MVTKNNQIAEASDRVLEITRVFDAPRSLLFEVWTDPDHLKRWQVAPKGFVVTAEGKDVRPGAVNRMTMRSPDGVDHRLQIVYQEITPPERLVFTHAWLNAEGKLGHETVVTVTFEEYGSKTRLTLRQGEFKSRDSRDGHRGGWSETLDGLEEYLAKL